MFEGTEDWCKIWRKTDLQFQKWHEKFGKLSQASVAFLATPEVSWYVCNQPFFAVID